MNENDAKKVIRNIAIIVLVSFVLAISTCTYCVYKVQAEVKKEGDAWQKYKVDHHCKLKAEGLMTSTVICDDGAEHTHVN